MTDTLCPISHDPERSSAPGIVLCRGHAKALPDKIQQLAELHHDLDHVLVRSGTASEKVSTSTNPGININVEAVDIRHDIRDSMASWALIVCEERGITHPIADDVDTLAHFLTTHADWLSAQPFIDELWSDLIYDPQAQMLNATDRPLAKAEGRDPRDYRALMSRARSLVQPSGTRRARFNERCIDTSCTGLLVALIRDTDELLPSKVWCEKCGQEWPAGSWLTLGRKLRERDAG